jgi:hypothetical protein
MKITIDHAKKFVKQYELSSGVTLSEKDVLFCMDYVFAEAVPAKDNPAKDNPAKPELTEESIRKIVDEYLSRLKAQETSPHKKYPDYWPDIPGIPYWPTYPHSGVYAYMGSFPLSDNNNITYTTNNTQDPNKKD